MRRASELFLLWSLILSLRAEPHLRGVVRDAAGGEPLARVRVTLSCSGGAFEQRTGPDGRFEFAQDGAFGCLLSVSLVGYHPLRSALIGNAELDLILTPDALSRRDAVTVSAGPFDPIVAASPSERTLTGSEIKNLAGVLADDPLRAVQALPGVASSNDYVAQFAVRGAAFQNVGVYLDGILLHNPFHTVQSQQEVGSLSILNADLVEELTLYTGAPPVIYPDRIAGALDLRLRDGSRQTPTFRVNAGVASAGLLAEGPLSRSRRGSWVVAARKSYLQYLLNRSAEADESLAFGYFDVQGRLTYDVDPSNQISVGILDGVSSLDRSRARNSLGVNSIMDAGYHTSLVTLGWRASPTPSLFITNRAGWMRERSENRNSLELPLNSTGYGEWIWNYSVLWNWNERAPFQGGGSFRRISDEGFEASFGSNPFSQRSRNNWGATAVRAVGYLEQAWTAGRFSGTAGASFDGSTAVAPRAISPHASVLIRLTRSTRAQIAWSQAVQYPALMTLSIENMGNPLLLPERATHAVGALEQSLGSRTRIRAEVFQRSSRDLIAQPLSEPRLLSDGQIYNPPPYAPFMNSIRGSARGIEIFLQRRTANRLAGWISYAYARTDMRDGVTGARYPADSDQRHTVNVYGSYRISPTINLSVRYSYGSNFPIPGFLRLSGNLYYLDTQRNALRLQNYHRADFRLNKSFHHQSTHGKTWRGVLYIEVMNLTNHDNLANDTSGGYSPRTGEAFPKFLKLFPIVPAAGVMFEWESGLLKP